MGSDATRLQVRKVVITLTIGEKLDYSTIPHVILRVRTFKDLVGIIANVIHGKHEGQTYCPLFMQEISKRAIACTSPLKCAGRASTFTYVLWFVCDLAMQYQAWLPSPHMIPTCWANQARYILRSSRQVVCHLISLCQCRTQIFNA